MEKKLVSNRFLHNHQQRSSSSLHAGCIRQPRVTFRLLPCHVPHARCRCLCRLRLQASSLSHLNCSSSPSPLLKPCGDVKMMFCLKPLWWQANELSWCHQPHWLLGPKRTETSKTRKHSGLCSFLSTTTTTIDRTRNTGFRNLTSSKPGGSWCRNLQCTSTRFP